MSWCVSPWIYPVWDSLCFLDLINYFLFHIREVFTYNLFKYFLRPILFLFFLWDPCNLNVGVFNVVPDVSEIVLNCFYSLFCSVAVISTILSSSSLIHPSASVILLLIPSSVLFTSVIVLFITVCLFFSSSRPLLNISYFLNLCLQFLIFGLSLLSLIWILFQVRCLFPLYFFNFPFHF